MKNQRFRAFMIVLYPDDVTHSSVLDCVISTIDDYAYILHDKDFNENGELIKQHYHVLIRLKDACTISALSNRLGVAENYIEPTKNNYINGLRYLIHKDNKEKYQYEIDNVIGTLKETLIKDLDKDKNESDYILELMDLIESLGYITITEFVKIIASSGLWSYYRRNAYTFNLVIIEHNHNWLELKNKKLT